MDQPLYPSIAAEVGENLICKPAVWVTSETKSEGTSAMAIINSHVRRCVPQWQHVSRALMNGISKSCNWSASYESSLANSPGSVFGRARRNSYLNTGRTVTWYLQVR